MESKKTSNSSKKNLSLNSIVGTIQDNLPSLLIGFLIFILLLIGLTHFIQNRDQGEAAMTTNKVEKQTMLQKIKDVFTNQAPEDKTPEKKAPEVKTYTVASGDNLWMIAEKNYKSGYNAYDIAKANNINDPNMINEGQKLVIPDISPKEITTAQTGQTSSIASGEVTIKTDSYTVQTGDSLWVIAQKSYGDGYMWTRLAKANEISNPDLIYAGDKIVIPRNDLAMSSTK
jgi:nucleoid-associated protein YgaU